MGETQESCGTAVTEDLKAQPRPSWRTPESDRLQARPSTSSRSSEARVGGDRARDSPSRPG